jgi:hypothetical protein
MRWRSWLMGAALLVASCGASDAPYNRLDKLRVLAVRAERPSLRPGEATLLEALVYTPDDAPVDYHWSYCPVRGGAGDGYRCLVTPTQLEASLLSAGIEGVSVDFGLGEAPSAQFSYQLPADFLRSLCQASAAAVTSSSGGAAPACASLTVSVDLVVRSGGAEVHAIKDLELLLDAEGEVNANPSVTGVRFGRRPTAAKDAALIATGEPLSALKRGENYDLYAEIPESAAETYAHTPTAARPETEARERLTLTWFVEVGDTRSMRTSFLDGQNAFANLLANTWQPPFGDEFTGPGSRLILVIRDERGGVSWLTERVQFSDE